jgi:F-type H+-transporting ATPase subunit b
MSFGAEFYVLIGFVVFVGIGIYLGAHRMVLSALDARGQAVADELKQATNLRDEANALLASLEKKKSEAEAAAKQIIADAKTEAERLAKDAAERMTEFVARRTQQAEATIAFAERQAAADVRAAAADRAAQTAEFVLRRAVQGQTADALVSTEIGAIGKKLN